MENIRKTLKDEWGPSYRIFDRYFGKLPECYCRPGRPFVGCTRPCIGDRWRSDYGRQKCETSSSRLSTHLTGTTAFE